MTVFGGKYGVVDGVDTVRNWAISIASTVPQWAASNTLGGTGRGRGVLSWSGSYARYGATPLHYPGEFFEFVGYTAPDTGVYGTPGQVRRGMAIVDSVAITWNWATGELLAQVVNFSGHMVLEHELAAYEDTSLPVPEEPHGTKIVYGAATEWENLVSATLTLSAPSQAYVTSSTHDATTEKIWTGRTPGRFDWTLAVTVQNTREDALPALESKQEYKLYTSATEFWLLKWGIARDRTGITVDTESGAIIQATCNIDKTAVKEGEVAVGSVIAPDLTQVWPYVAPPPPPP